MSTSAHATGTEVHIDSSAGLLAGTLLQPATTPAAAVVILPGSGPTDRNGDNPIGVKGSPYRLLADALATNGIASVRVDKRGMFGSHHAAGFDPNNATIADYAEDAHGWAAYLAKATRRRCVWLLGHSEGALVAELAAQEPHGICGLVPVAGAGRRAAEILRTQLAANPGNAPFLPQVLPVIDALNQGRPVDPATIPAPFLPLFNAKVQPYLIQWFRQDPVALLARYSGPVLVIQGDNDLQIGLADARALAAARKDVALKVIPGMNHVLRQPAAGRAANLASYGDATMPLAPGLVDAIARFIRDASH